MYKEDALKSLKKRLDIDDVITDFDEQLSEYLDDAASRLSPSIYDEADPFTVTITRDSNGFVVLSLSDEAIDDVRKVELIDSGGRTDADSFRVHGSFLYLSDVPTGVSQIIIYGLCEFTLDTVPRYLHLPVYYYAMSEFYGFLMANKASYNVYMQNGRAATDNMKDIADYFEQKADDYIANKATPYGR